MPNDEDPSYMMVCPYCGRVWMDPPCPECAREIKRNNQVVMMKEFLIQAIKYIPLKFYDLRYKIEKALLRH
jgi:hypothetical protein